MSGIIILAVLIFCFLLFAPIKLDKPYRLSIKPNQGYSQTTRILKENGAIRSRYVMLLVGYLTNSQKELKPGMYKIQDGVSTWNIIQHLKLGHPEKLSLTINEGMTFAQFRARVNASEGIIFEVKNISEKELLKKLDSPYEKAEGLLFPSTYVYNWGDSDLSLYRQAYQFMQTELENAWEDRQAGLPYKEPYELLIMASIIEKETAHPDDREKVSAVFVNRLNTGMRLQTDPTVIYGMGERYRGKLYRSEWRRDSAYNTYTRDGLTPTPIALPGKEALHAAAHPSSDQYLYFVSRMDGTGLSQFSHTLDEHNQAIKDYIRKKKK